MKKILYISLIIIAGSTSTFYSCTHSDSKKSEDPIQVGLSQIILKPNLPADVAVVLNQNEANAFAWQSFIALTWPASPDFAGEPDKAKGIHSWGSPGDLTPMTFGTFKSVEEVFSDSVPSPWGSNLYGIMHEMDNPDDFNRKISRLHKLNDPEIMDEITQATGSSTPWLTDQEGNQIWYEIKINKKEFDFIFSNELYNIEAQEAYLDGPNGPQAIWLPHGAIEIKASWRIIPKDQLDELKHRYKIIRASVPASISFDNVGNPILKNFREEYLGLVGLHIIQKTPSAPQFIWATFEHEDLAPIEKVCCPDHRWLLYNPDKCFLRPNVAPVSGKDSLNKPIQVVKMDAAIPNLEAVKIDELVHTKLKELYPESVFQYYHLVDAQWPSSAVADSDNGPYTPLSNGGKTPFVLTNVSMETYVQGKSCLSCHVGAGITKPSNDKLEYATDYSFVFGMAKNIHRP